MPYKTKALGHSLGLCIGPNTYKIRQLSQLRVRCVRKKLLINGELTDQER
jgi:hypothetical protein